jgi:predicted SAM-dependent methyltransferase
MSGKRLACVDKRTKMQSSIYQNQSKLSLFDKLSYYRKKYNLTHAIGSYIGRLSPLLWKYIGPLVTKQYIVKWAEKVETKILNLGGGSNCIPGSLTVDISPRADAYVDITQELPFADNSVDFIFCEEVIEHVKFPIGCQLLRECYRILKPNGTLRLSTPDLDWFVGRLTQPNACLEINSIFYEHEHRYLYTRQALLDVCKETGFINLKHSTYKNPESLLGYLDSHADRFNHPPEMSQYLEAKKPGES